MKLCFDVTLIPDMDVKKSMEENRYSPYAIVE
jgi:hypothetical protein